MVNSFDYCVSSLSICKCREMILPACVSSYCKLSIGLPHLETLDYKLVTTCSEQITALCCSFYSFVNDVLESYPYCRYLIGVGVLDGTFYLCYLQANLLRELGMALSYWEKFAMYQYIQGLPLYFCCIDISWVRSSFQVACVDSWLTC